MKKNSILRFIGVILLIIADALRLGVIMKDHIQSLLGELLREQFLWQPALLFYMLYSAAILLFVVHPALEKQDNTYAYRYGAALGFTAYMTYDLSNLATLKLRPREFVIIDIIRGTLLTMVTAYLMYCIAKKIQ